MTDNTQPEALRLAKSLDLAKDIDYYNHVQDDLKASAAELRRQHARIAELEAQLDSIGAGGVNGPLMTPTAANAGSDGGASLSAAEPAVDMKAMQLAESVGLIGPASRAHDLHAAIQRFYDLICVNATIKAAAMAAEAISGAATISDGRPSTPARDYPPLPMQFACSGAWPVYSADQMRAYVDADRAPTLTQGAAIAAGAVYAELLDDVIDYVKGSYAFLQSTAPDGYAEEVFRLPPSATRNQRALQDALQSDKRGGYPAAARQDSGDGKRSGPDAGVSASHGQAPAQPISLQSAHDAVTIALLNERVAYLEAKLAQQVPSTPASGGWMPIETAPRDGTRFLAAARINCSDGTAWWERQSIYVDEESGIVFYDGGDDTGWELTDYRFWQPLPASPTIEGESK